MYFFNVYSSEVLFSWISLFFTFFQGFCCSCVDSVNAERQPRTSERVLSDIENLSTLTKKKIQPRSEQDCLNISTSPSYVNPVAYHESSHCFRYSDLW